MLTMEDPFLVIKYLLIATFILSIISLLLDLFELILHTNFDLTLHLKRSYILTLIFTAAMFILSLVIMIELSNLVIPISMCDNIKYDAQCLNGGAAINGWSSEDHIITANFETDNLTDFNSKSCIVNSLPDVTSICSKPSFLPVQNTTTYSEIKLFKEKSLSIVIVLLETLFVGFISIKLRLLIQHEREYNMY
jgi:hypothetical protein